MNLFFILFFVIHIILTDGATLKQKECVDLGSYCEKLNPFDCQYNLETCCKSCQKFFYLDKECKFEENELWCSIHLKNLEDCLKPDVAENCCLSCNKIKNRYLPQITEKPQWDECPARNDESFCLEINPYDCYEYKERCCHTCKKYLLYQEDNCKYGDILQWCHDIIIYKEDCMNPLSKFICCKTCQKFFPSNTTTLPTTTTTTSPTTSRSLNTDKPIYNPTNFPSSTTESKQDELICSDKKDESFCFSINSFDCYSLRDQCCHTCKVHYKTQPNCEFDDKMSWCSSYVRSVEDCLNSEVSNFCCNSCNKIKNKTISFPFTTSKPMEPNSTRQDMPETEEPRWEECPDKEDEPLCSDIKSNDCYNYKERCCHTCKKYFVPQDGCMFGDKVPWCGNYVKGPEECKRPEVKLFCCQTCQMYPSPNSTTPPPTTTTTKNSKPFKTTIFSSHSTTTSQPSFISTLKKDELICSDKEDEPFCSNMRIFDCYNQRDQCCHTCKNHYFNKENCSFGDKVDWCSSYVKGVEECMRPEVKTLCCKTCHSQSEGTTPIPTPSTFAYKSSINPTTQCENKREEAYCSALNSYDCYNNNQVCCGTCLQFKLQQPNCDFGDKVPWCASYVKGIQECQRPEVADFCCKTCNKFKK